MFANWTDEKIIFDFCVKSVAFRIKILMSVTVI